MPRVLRSTEKDPMSPHQPPLQRAHWLLRSLPEGRLGERVPLGHSSGWPLLFSEKLFETPLPEGVEAWRARAGFFLFFDFGLLRFIQFVRGVLQRSRQGRLHNPPSLQLRLATRQFHFPKDLDWRTIPIAFATSTATLRGSPGKRVSG